MPNSGGVTCKVPRLDLNDFSVDSILDLCATDTQLKGFYGGFTDGALIEDMNSLTTSHQSLTSTLPI